MLHYPRIESFAGLSPVLFLAVAFACAVTTTSSVAQGFDWPDKMENATVLPESTTSQELSNIMRGFTGALGVRCNFCHVGQPGQSLSEYDFASDDVPEKGVARVMMRMVREINGSHLASLEKESGRQVTCVTCHRGIRTPVELDELLFETHEREGSEAAVAQYRELREAYYGSAAYDFSEGTLLGSGQRVEASGDAAGAAAFYRLNTEFFPESGNSYMLLGNALVASGERDAGIEALEQALDYATNPRARQRIERALESAREED